MSSLIALLSPSCQTLFTDSVTSDVEVAEGVSCSCFLEVVPQVTGGTLVLPNCLARPGANLTVLGEYDFCYDKYKPPPALPPKPLMPPLPPFTPLADGEAIIETSAEVVTLQFVVAGDVSSVDLAGLTAALKTETGCFAPCELMVSLVSASVSVQAQMVIPSSQASTVASVTAASQSFANKSPSQLTTTLSSVGVTVTTSAVVSQTSQMMAMMVAPPSPSSPPSLPPPSSPPPPESSSSNTGGIIGGVIGGISAPLFGALGYYAYKKKKQQQVKVVSASYS